MSLSTATFFLFKLSLLDSAYVSVSRVEIRSGHGNRDVLYSEQVRGHPPWMGGWKAYAIDV
jgi:hypothetical protein